MSIFSRINKLDDQIAEQNYHRLYYEARKVRLVGAWKQFQ